MPGPMSEPWTGYPSDPFAIVYEAEQAVRDVRADYAALNEPCEHNDSASCQDCFIRQRPGLTDLDLDLCDRIDALVSIVRQQERLLDLCRDTPREVDAQRIAGLEARIEEHKLGDGACVNSRDCIVCGKRIEPAMGVHAECRARERLTR